MPEGDDPPCDAKPIRGMRGGLQTGTDPQRVVGDGLLAPLTGAVHHDAVPPNEQDALPPDQGRLHHETGAGRGSDGGLEEDFMKG